MPRNPWLARALAIAALVPVAACAAGLGDAPSPGGVDLAGYELFTANDLDRDGAISPAELEAGLAPATPAETRRLFGLLDRDHDGALGLAEYYPDPGAVQAFGFTEHRADR